MVLDCTVGAPHVAIGKKYVLPNIQKKIKMKIKKKIIELYTRDKIIRIAATVLITLRILNMHLLVARDKKWGHNNHNNFVFMAPF